MMVRAVVMIEMKRVAKRVDYAQYVVDDKRIASARMLAAASKCHSYTTTWVVKRQTPHGYSSSSSSSRRQSRR
jgi:hypothetical protein